MSTASCSSSASAWTASTSSDPKESERFAAKVCDPERHRTIAIEPDVGALLRRSDLVLFATSAGEPWVDQGASLQHHPVILHLSLRDLSPKIIVECQNVVDDVDHAMTAGTSVHLAEQATRGRAFLTGTLAGVWRGSVSLARTAPIVFSPFGLGVLDLAVGKWVFDRAMRAGQATLLPDFFHDMSR